MKSPPDLSRRAPCGREARHDIIRGAGGWRGGREWFHRSRGDTGSAPSAAERAEGGVMPRVEPFAVLTCGPAAGLASKSLVARRRFRGAVLGLGAVGLL